MSDVKIVSPSPRHVKAVVQLLVAQMDEHGIGLERERTTAVVHEILSHPEFGFLLVALEGEQVVGVAYLAIILSAELSGRAGWLEELYVLPSFRGHGVGQSLLAEVEQRSRALGLMAIELEVDIEHRRAEKLYQRCGFIQRPRSRWVKELNGES